MEKSSLAAGFLNVNKASGMTAHDVVARVRKISGVKQVGHAGTLDPMARGVLPIAIGKACRLLRFLSDDKIYLASILFGQSTDTDDIEGKVIARSEKMPDEKEITESLKTFIGDIKQIPPIYSAIHVNGKRLYELARKGETPAEIPVRNVHVFSIQYLDYKRMKNDDGIEAAILKLRIHCSTGTYIRSIARDLGEMLASKACLSSLEREKAGPFELGTAVSLEDLVLAKEQGSLTQLLEPPENKLLLKKLELTQEQCKRLAFGQRVNVEDELAGSEFVLALLNGKIIAVCSVVEAIENAPITPNESEDNAAVTSNTSDISKMADASHPGMTNKSSTKGSSTYNVVGLKPEVVLTDGSDI